MRSTASPALSQADAQQAPGPLHGRNAPSAAQRATFGRSATGPHFTIAPLLIDWRHAAFRPPAININTINNIGKKNFRGAPRRKPPQTHEAASNIPMNERRANEPPHAPRESKGPLNRLRSRRFGPSRQRPARAFGQRRTPPQQARLVRNDLERQRHRRPQTLSAPLTQASTHPSRMSKPAMGATAGGSAIHALHAPRIRRLMAGWAMKASRRNARHSTTRRTAPWPAANTTSRDSPCRHYLSC